MAIKLNSLTVKSAIAACCLSCASYAQDNPCKAIQPGATLQETSGCMPLTFKPADGGPVQVVWVPVTFVGPVQRTSTSPAAANKYHDLDVGLSAFYVKPDYDRGSNVDVGAFVAYTAKYFGAEIDAADTVRSGSGVHEPFIVGGPRIQYRTRHFTVFAKAQAGEAHFSGAPVQPIVNKKNFVVENYGVGLEFKISRHLKIRAVDANYQIWPTFSANNLTPFRIGSGIAFSL